MNEPDEAQLSLASTDHQDDTARKGVLAQLRSLLRSLGASSERRPVILLTSGIVIIICATAVGQIRLNAWQGSFYDALEQRDLHAFARQIFVFAIIVSILLVLAVSQTWLHELMKVKLREWLTRDLLDEWLVPGRAHRLHFAGEIGVNPDQRMQEDARHLTELSAGLGVGLLQATLLLVSFLGVLWVLSAQVVFVVGDRTFFIPGYMVWCALYGLSARALTLDTGGSEPEEFPFFRSFWIERPADQQSITVHGLLDSPSVTGAYTFVIGPGAETVMDVDAQIFPRRDLANVGFAPLTSMFLKDTHDSDGPSDFGPAVHDSDGFAAWNGRGERLWRPLVNPLELQISCFHDNNPKASGLIQHERKFDGYQDLEADYQDRPSAWIEPKGNWGYGCAQLVEIPTRAEYFDNIVAFWRPDAALLAGHAYTIGYRLAWCDDAPAWNGYRVGRTRIGEGSRSSTVRFVAVYLDSRNKTHPKLEQVASVGLADVLLRPMPEAVFSSSAGVIGNPLVQRNPESGGIRVTFEFDPQDRKESELRLALFADAERVSEVWLFRWRSKPLQNKRFWHINGLWVNWRPVGGFFKSGKSMT